MLEKDILYCTGHTLFSLQTAGVMEADGPGPPSVQSKEAFQHLSAVHPEVL